MADLIISCLSQKGGVGKSTLARLIATAYAAHEQRVCIYDFNGAQQTSVFWAEIRAKAGIEPLVAAELAQVSNRMATDRRYDVIVADGRPDSPDITLSTALNSDLVIIPTSFTVDDLVPQRKFAFELITRGIEQHRIMFVLNRVIDHKQLTQEALEYLSDFRVAKTSLPYRASYVRAHTTGYSIGEVGRMMLGNFDRMTQLTDDLTAEIATYAMETSNV
ncbi:ParA family protein [Paracoccus litorisediminis]|uniref:P-loop NTPase n=1 Tax=Paracoccus litorisediminis TaxID=2006130 RepID=A0A844HUJ9_9RHOB|nr:ParA family protein [Paracoccus litorisediminis]MTH61182.1 P-loop NTPase [Paracoccus litorisediminis]